jgi:hypothetical protein
MGKPGLPDRLRRRRVPYSTDLRRWGLATPQGFDPFLPTQYHEVIERWVKFQTNRLFPMDLHNGQMLRALGVRYAITHEGSGNDPYLSASPDFHLVGKDDAFYRVYEYRAANAPFGWEDGSGDVRPAEWGFRSLSPIEARAEKQGEIGKNRRLSVTSAGGACGSQR